MTLSPIATPDIYKSLGVRRVVNGAGPATRLGGMRLNPRVVDAMRDASQACVRMEELHRQAGAYIAAATGTQAAVVTCGAGAGLALAAAACIAGYDVSAINHLPSRIVHGAPPRHEVVMLRAQRYPYDHLLRAVGAEIVDVGYFESTHLYEVEAALGDQTAAFLYYPSQPSAAPPLADIVAACHRRNVPVIVDAALESVPPVLDHLFVDAGADLVVFSGGKRLGGPQASGVLCGRHDLVESAMLQMLDMDVRPQTWVEDRLISEKFVPGPPHHGLGRAMKVGKEEIAGLVTAIQIFLAEDHAQRAAADAQRLEQIAEAAIAVPGISMMRSQPGAFAPRLTLLVDEGTAGYDVWSLLRHMQNQDLPVHLNEAEAWRGRAIIDPLTLLPGDEVLVRDALRHSFGELGAGSPAASGRQDERTAR
jgi:D-glucosaminate-6-phosphate ammonia-lyase